MMVLVFHVHSIDLDGKGNTVLASEFAAVVHVTS